MSLQRQFDVDDYDISTITDFNIRRIDSVGFPSTDVKISPSLTDDGGLATSLYYRDKVITVSGEIAASSYEDMQTAVREIMNRCQGVNKTLNFDVEGTRTVYTASMENVSMKESRGGFMEIKLMFVAHDPIGVSAGYNSTTDTGITAIDNDTAVTVAGSYHALPVITLTINSITVTNPATVTITSDNGALAISRDWAVNEVLIIDSESRTVKVDGTAVLYSGILPTLNVGSTDITYDDTFTARNIDILLKHKTRFL